MAVKKKNTMSVHTNCQYDNTNETHRRRCLVSEVRNNPSVMSNLSIASMSCAARTCDGPYSALSGRSANVSKKASSAATSFAAFVSAILLETCQRIKHDVITLIARTMHIKYKRTSGD